MCSDSQRFVSVCELKGMASSINNMFMVILLMWQADGSRTSAGGSRRYTSDSRYTSRIISLSLNYTKTVVVVGLHVAALL